MPILENYIKLVRDKTEVVHLKDHVFQPRLIRDSITGQLKTVRALVFTVDERGGQTVDVLLSTISDTLADIFEPYLEGKRYQLYTFAITKRGEGFAVDWEVQALPRGSAARP